MINALGTLQGIGQYDGVQEREGVGTNAKVVYCYLGSHICHGDVSWAVTHVMVTYTR